MKKQEIGIHLAIMATAISIGGIQMYFVRDIGSSINTAIIFYFGLLTAGSLEKIDRRLH